MKKLIGLLIFFQIFYLFSASAGVAAKLPPEPIMKAELIHVLNENRIKEEYYPLLLKHAGLTKTPQEVVDMFDQETEAFLAQFSEEESKLVRVQLVPYIVPYIRAILKGYPKEAAEAVRIHQETNRPPRT